MEEKARLQDVPTEADDTYSMTVTDSQKASQYLLNKDFWKHEHYVLSSDFQGTTRLAFQQHIWRQSLGFNVHPSVPKLTPTSAIADIACGTALWLIEVGRDLGESSDLHGFDLNLHQAPVKPWLPRNITLHVWNIFDDVPPLSAGKFDLVHVRLINVVLKNKDIDSVIHNLYKLLKPGGYLQWDEIDEGQTSIVKASSDLDAPGADAFCKWAMGPKYGDTRGHEWKQSTVSMLERNGFEHVKQFDLGYKFRENMVLMRYNADQMLMLAENLVRRSYAPEHEKYIEVLKIIEQAGKDVENGAIIFIPPVIWTAMRPREIESST